MLPGQQPTSLSSLPARMKLISAPSTGLSLILRRPKPLPLNTPRLPQAALYLKPFLTPPSPTIPTHEMPADGLTKALSIQQHEKFVKQLGLIALETVDINMDQVE